MLFAMLAMMQSAVACGPYGGFAASPNGTVAFEDGDVITVFTSEGEQVTVPIYGEISDMEFVDDDLVVAFRDEDGSFAILFDQTGEEVAEWEPRQDSATIEDIRVLPRGIAFVGITDERTYRVLVNDNLQQLGFSKAPRTPFW